MCEDEALAVQVMERTERLMMKAIFRYREDQDLENAIDFIQKKVSMSWCDCQVFDNVQCW